MLYSHELESILALLVRLLESLHRSSHTLIISSKSKKSIVATTKVKLSIPQLTLAKLAQSERHESATHEIPKP